MRGAAPIWWLLSVPCLCYNSIGTWGLVLAVAVVAEDLGNTWGAESCGWRPSVISGW